MRGEAHPTLVARGRYAVERNLTTAFDPNMPGGRRLRAAGTLAGTGAATALGGSLGIAEMVQHGGGATLGAIGGAVAGAASIAGAPVTESLEISVASTALFVGLWRGIELVDGASRAQRAEYAGHMRTGFRAIAVGGAIGAAITLAGAGGIDLAAGAHAAGALHGLVSSSEALGTASLVSLGVGQLYNLNARRLEGRSLPG